MLPRIRLLSDLHLEFRPNAKALITELESHLDFSTGPPSEEILVLAGDIGWPTSPEFTELLSYFRRSWAEVILVPGNHEYYATRGTHMTIADIDQLTRDISKRVGVHFLQKDEIVLQGVRFLGCTLWSDVTLDDYEGLNDRWIHDNDFLCHMSRHINHREWLENALAESKQDTIVITHHLPSAKLLVNSFRATGYYTELDSVIAKHRATIKLWLCGHTHERNHVVISGVPCLTNPLGYPEEDRNTEVNWSVIT